MLHFLPEPRQIVSQPGTCELLKNGLILLDADPPASLRFAAERLQACLKSRCELNWEIHGNGLSPTPDPHSEIILTLAPQRMPYSQGYLLEISSTGVYINAHDEPGAFYGVCTLIQMLDQCGHRLPCVEISDWPDFPARGVMLDISRDKVPTNETLFDLIDLLAGWKINQIQLYTEHTFAYRRHPTVWQNASPLTAQDIQALDRFCRDRSIDLVPNQNSFGHLQRWLTLPTYAPLAETHEPFQTPYGLEQGPFSLCPLDPGSLELIHGLYDELLPNFSCSMFNVGCDETFDVGQGRSHQTCERLGKGRVYLDYLLAIYREVRARGKTMQFWGDIILQNPELIPELPKDSIALEWGYEADHPYEEHGAQFQAAGLPFYVCPGTSSWCSLGGRTENAIANLRSAAENGLKYGAAGYLITDWGG